MKVTFSKTEVRRYGVYVQRDEAPDLRLYGPGYSDDLPHDLLHFVAEARFGLDGGVFGDVAAGGNARIFQPVDTTLTAKMWRRERMHPTRLPEGRRSEHLARMLEEAWEAHRNGSPLSDGWKERTAAAGIDPSAVEELVPMLDELASRWRALGAGEGITLEWPRREGRKRHPPRDRRRPARRR